MGRFIDDFLTISKGMGLRHAIKLIFRPRVLRRFGFKANLFYNAIDSFVSSEFNDIIVKYKLVDDFQQYQASIPRTIWVFWWQGKDSMPEVIQHCYNSTIRNANGRKVILITKDNIDEYITLPEIVINKVQSGKVSFTHFSDLLRVALLYKYGGLWIDAAIYVTKPIPQQNCWFYSPKLTLKPQDTPHLNLWVIGVMAAPPNMPLFSYLYDMLVRYWATYNVEFTYLMLDYFIRYGYENFSWLKELIDNRPLDSPDLHTSRYLFKEEVNHKHLDQLVNNNLYLSLTYRIPYPMQLANGQETYYSALLAKYKQ